MYGSKCEVARYILRCWSVICFCVQNGENSEYAWFRVVDLNEQHLPPGFKYNPDATPVQFSGPEGDAIEKGTAVRVQILGMRSDVNQLFAIGKMSSSWFG